MQIYKLFEFENIKIYKLFLSDLVYKMSVKMKKLIFCFVFLVLCFQLISATDTNIHIKTVPDMNVNVLVVSSSFEQYERFNANADKYGDVSFVFSSDKTNFGLNIYVKDLQDNSKVASGSLEDQDAGEDIDVEIIPNGFKIVETPAEENVSTGSSTLTSDLSNETENNTLEELFAATEKNVEKSKITGKAIFGENSNIKKIILYVGGVIILIIIVFFIFKKLKRGKGEIKIRKFSDWKEDQKDTPGQYYGVLEETQRKLEETQKELNMVRNKDKIKETEEKLKRDEQELRNLRGF